MGKLKLKDENDQWLEAAANGYGIPSGGTTGQMLVKSSNTDYATGWVTPLLYETGTWTPVMARANVTSSSGEYFVIGALKILTGMMVFSNSQSDQGNIYLDVTSYPDIGISGIVGIGAAADKSLGIDSQYVNDNAWVTLSGSRINATNGAIKNQTLRFTLISCG